MKKLLCCFLLTFSLFTCGVYSQSETLTETEKPFVVTAEHKAAILKLFEVSGYMGELEEMKGSLLNRVFLMIPDMNDKDWEKIKSEVTLDTLLNQQVNAYAEKFTTEEINELIKIFSTDVYKKMKKYGEMLSEALYANENYFFTELKYVLGEKIDKKGYEVPDYLKKEKIENPDDK